MIVTLAIVLLGLFCWNIVLSLKIRKNKDCFNQFMLYCNALFDLQTIINGSTGTLLQIMVGTNAPVDVDLNTINDDLNKMFDQFKTKKDGELPTLDNLVEGDPDE